MCIIILTVGRRVNFFSWRAVAASADSFTSCQHPQHGQSTVSFHVVQIFLLGRRHPLAFCWGWFVNDKKKTCYSFSPGHSPIPVISGSRSPRRHPPYGLFQKVSTLLCGVQWVNSGVLTACHSTFPETIFCFPRKLCDYPEEKSLPQATQNTTHTYYLPNWGFCMENDHPLSL